MRGFAEARGRRVVLALVVAGHGIGCVWDVPPHPLCETHCALSEDGNRQRCGFCSEGRPINCDGFWHRTAGAQCSSEAPCGAVDLGGGENEAQCLSDAQCEPPQTLCSADGQTALECVRRPDGSSAFAHHLCQTGRTCGEGLGRCDL